jgi:hypothetical protein
MGVSVPWRSRRISTGSGPACPGQIRHDRSRRLAGAGSDCEWKYPLFHKLYLAFMPHVSPRGAGFVSFLFSPRAAK